MLEFDDHLFKRKDFGDESWEGAFFTDTSFDGCNFSKSNFSRARFLDCTINDSNCTLINLQRTRLQGVRFIESKIVGVDFSQCDPFFLELHFFNCLLDGCNFSGLECKRSTFDRCTIRRTHFAHCNVSEANFSGSDFSESVFHDVNLEGANFREATNYAISPLTNRVKGAQFSSLEALSLLEPFEIVIV